MIIRGREIYMSPLWGSKGWLHAFLHTCRPSGALEDDRYWFRFPCEGNGDLLNKTMVKYTQDLRKLRKSAIYFTKKCLAVRVFQLFNPLNPPYRRDFKRKCVSPNIQLPIHQKIGEVRKPRQRGWRVFASIEM